MNYGLSPAEDASSLHAVLTPADQPNQFCIRLYERVVSPAKLANADVLEVGSGRGGGASFLARYKKPKRTVGVDYSPQAVAFCRRRHTGIANLEFQVGDAEKLPFPEASFDVVVNVESSHCYGNVEAFFREVIRVLRPGGYFVYADLRGAADMHRLQAVLTAQNGWTEIEREDITAPVAAALEADDRRKRQMILELVPPKLRPVFEEFAGVSGGQVFRGLKSRDLLYFRFAFQRLR